MCWSRCELERSQSVRREYLQISFSRETSAIDRQQERRRSRRVTSFSSLFSFHILLLLTIPSLSIAFQLKPTSSSHRLDTLLLSTKKGGRGSKRPVKKPRFTQDTDTTISRPTTTDTFPPQRTKNATPQPRVEEAESGGSTRRPIMAEPPRSMQQQQRNGPAVPPKVNKERMWKRETSIDDLESRLAKRWGTDLRQWTANDDFEEGDEDEDADVVQAPTGRPVKDPWLSDDEKEEIFDRSGGQKAPSSKKRSVLGAFAAKANDSPPPTTKDTSPQTQKSSPLSAFGSPRPAMDLSHLIADTPAGGEKPEAAKKKKRVEKQVIPLTDNGEPLFLTVGQAERFFQENGGLDETQSIDDQPSWSDLGIQNEQILENLGAMGCASPLAVQRNSCEHILSSVDAVVGTYTGSEKMLRQPELERKLRLIVVAPGRELASQITTVTRDIVAGTNLTVQLAIGGTTFSRNLEMIRKRKPDILIGTPGRIAALVVGDGEQRRGRLAIQHLDTIVCDEFDALLEYKAHRDPTHALLTTLKRQRRDRLQSILCSATASDMLKEKKKVDLEERYLRPGYVITMAEDDDCLVTSGGKTKTRVSRTVMHGVVHVPHRRFALETLRRILHTEPLPQQILIFVSDARRVPIVVDRLADRGIVAAPLHGDSDKTDRAEVSKALRDGYVGIVVSTELAARGLDAPLLTHVINMDLPTDASHYAHRAGRCGRGGRPGVVINFTTSPQERKVPERMAGELGIDMYTIDVKNSKLNVVDPASVELDVQET